MTSVSELSNPRPSSGFSDFPALQNHASHSEGSSLGSYSASHQTSVFHPAVNSTANYPFFCGAFAQNWQQQYTEGMPMFICRQKREKKNGRTPGGTLTGRHVTHNILASVPVINFYLTLGSCDSTFVNNFVKKYALNNALIPSVDVDELTTNLGGRAPTQPEIDQAFIDDFNKKWAFIGIVMTDMDVKSRYQKLFNLTVRGRCRVFNSWTTRIGSKYSRSEARDRVMKGDELYLTLKKEVLDANKHFMQPDGTVMPIFPACDNTNTIWQISCSRRSLTANRRPQIKDVDGNPQQHMYVGKVLSAVSKKPDEHYQKRSYREHTQLASLPMLEIAVHTGV